MKIFKKLTALAVFLFGVLQSYGQFPMTKVQLIHNSADAAAAMVDIYVNDLALPDGNDVVYKTATPFLNVPAGIPLKLDIAPGDSMSSDDSVFTTSVTLDASKTYIIVADGILSSTGYDPIQPFGLKIYDIALEAGANGTTMTDLLIHHGATDAPAVDVVNVTNGANSVLVPGIAYAEFVGYASLPINDYTLEIRGAGSPNAVATYIAPLESLSLGGAAITILASGFLDPAKNSDGAPFGLFAVTAAGGEFIALPAPTLGIETFQKSGVLAYPNPATSQLNINIPFSYQNASVKAFDMLGRQVLSKTLSNNGINTIAIESIRTGLYFLQLDVDGGILATKLQVK